jgi:hypothetical protein
VRYYGEHEKKSSTPFLAWTTNLAKNTLSIESTIGCLMIKREVQSTTVQNKLSIEWVLWPLYNFGEGL